MSALLAPPPAETTDGQVVAPGFLEPGLYQIPAERYHDDPAPEPSLSRSLAYRMIENTPKHGWLEHPRLGGGRSDRKKSRKLDVGSIAHELITGHGRGIHVIEALNKSGNPAESYQLKAAQEERDQALENGLMPALQCDLARAEKIVASARRVLAATRGAEGVFDADAKGGGEVCAIWRDPVGIYGRAMLDWYGPTPYDVWDFKTTGCGRLSNRELENRINEGLDMQAFWYMRGLSTLNPRLAGRLRFRFVFVEDDEPYEARVISLNPQQEWLGARRMLTAAVMFERGLRENVWPGFPRKIDTVPASPWHETRWLSREVADPLIQELGSKLTLALSPFKPIEVTHGE